MIKNIKKLINLVKNYDKIMMMVEKTDKDKLHKRCSTLNTPQNQLDAIEKIKGGNK